MARLERENAQLRDELSNHLTGGVDWIAAIGATAAAGTERYVEIGYGRVLSGLVKRIPSAAALANTRESAVGRLSGTVTLLDSCGPVRWGDVCMNTCSAPARLSCFLSFSAARLANSLMPPIS